MRSRYSSFRSRLAGVFGAALAAAFTMPGVAQDKAVDDARLTEPGQLAPLLDGLSELHHSITTTSDRAQKFFDQGLRLVYAFNHAEAIRSFREAQRLDPECAMAYWGEALALGPNLNVPMQPQSIAPAYAAAQKAVSLQAKASAPEQALIAALAKRYASDASADRATLDRAYAEAMGTVAEAHPADDALTLHADALMNLTPWNYYTRDGHPREGTPILLARLETVIARNPKHIGALHLYIHATEEHYPQLAEKAADALLPLTPTAGHLIHMPSHTFMRLGRYEDSFESNRRAVEADESYIAQCKAQGVYPLAYYPHNIHFLMWAAERQGRADEAIFQARKVAKQAHDSMAGMQFGMYQGFYVTPFFQLVRFGRWDEILKEPVPEEKLAYVQGVWRYARALAFLHTDQNKKAGDELAALEALISKGDFGGMTIGFADPKALLAVGVSVIKGELAAHRKKYDAAIAHLDQAIRLEDALPYSEPPDWTVPSRHVLGVVLLEAGRPADAEGVYWSDLKRNPNNGYALFGLWHALQAQPGREADAAVVKARFDTAWRNAKHTLTTSRF